MVGFVARRLLQGLLVVAVAATAAFVLLHLAPGDPVSVALGADTIPESTRTYWRAFYGLDRPLAEQYVRWVAGVARGNLGYSFSANRPVTDALLGALPNTLLLVGTALALGFAFGIASGVAQAAWRARGTSGGRALDRAVGAVAVFFFSVPDFWLAVALVVPLAVVLRWLPSSGTITTDTYDYLTFGERVVDRLRHLALPALTLALGLMAVVSRHQRAALLEVAREDYLRTARAKGVPDRAVLRHHALRNALLPVVTLAGLALPAVVGGVVFIESVFSWNGMGLLAVGAVKGRDYPLVSGVVILGSAAVTFGAILAELLHARLDPRVRDAG